MPQGSTIESEHSPRPNAIRRPQAIVVQCQAFWAAVQFLTRVPTPTRPISESQHEGPRLQLATIYFPLVGALIGLATGTVIWLASCAWPIWLAVSLGLVVEALLTGALHEDALADCCDALGGGWTRTDVLRILDDSRLGTYGVLGLAFALFLRAGALASLDASLLLPAVVASAAIGRWAMVLAMAWLAPLPDRPSLTQQTGRQTLGVHVFWGACTALAGSLPLAFQSPWRFGLSIAVVLAVTAWFVSYLRRRIGGTTGDAVGAVCYVSQIVVLLCCSLRWPWQ
ncbi:MAG TPA: adenosylcobinamide-GDP ribazoletransferase [Pirellulales bacterium]|nr:adenosylcobinamide-GDP ribazoletransferase [Pirellulales bacterium]